MTAKYPSLEMGWLPRPKDVSLPDICFVECKEYSGCYYRPEADEVMIGESFYDLNRGLIVCNTDDDPATIAHEFCHHLQFIHGVEMPGASWSAMKGTYQEKVIQYYTTYRTELDALLFEVIHYPDDMNRQWLEWVIKSVKPPLLLRDIVRRIP